MTAPTLEAERAAPELLPCPFCGGKVHSGTYSGEAVLACKACPATMGGEESTASAAELLSAWNRRTAAPASADVALPPLDAEGLSPLPQRTKFYPDRFGYALAYTSEQVRQVQREAYELGRQAAGREGAKQSEARMNAGFQPVVDNIDRAQLDALGKHGGNR